MIGGAVKNTKNIDEPSRSTATNIKYKYPSFLSVSKEIGMEFTTAMVVNKVFY